MDQIAQPTTIIDHSIPGFIDDANTLSRGRSMLSRLLDVGFCDPLRRLGTELFAIRTFFPGDESRGKLEVDVYLLRGGQSNMQGVGKIAELSKSIPEKILYAFYWNGSEFERARVGKDEGINARWRIRTGNWLCLRNRIFETTRLSDQVSRQWYAVASWMER